MNWIEVVPEKEKRKYDKEWYSIWKQFKKEFPELITRGTRYEPYVYGHMDILVSIPNKGKLVYNPVGTANGKIQWLERWTNEGNYDQRQMENKKREKEKRLELYETFLDTVQSYRREFNATQDDIAKRSGYSRKSINEYLNGKSIPKVSTMKTIIKSLGENNN